MRDHPETPHAVLDEDEDAGPSRDWTALRQHWAPLLSAFVLSGCVGYGVSYAFAPRYLSTTLFIPPQQQQGAAASALSSLSALSGLVGGSGIKNTTDQYISMLQGVTVSDNVIKRFKLAQAYGTDYMDDTRKLLSRRVQVSAGKKDGLITVAVEDTDPKRAADIANDYVDELRELTSHLAITDAQQRRVFFERLLNETRQRLVTAQIALEGSGFNSGALKAEPRSAADAYAKLRADLTAAQVKLQAMQSSLADSAPEVVQQRSVVQALGEQLTRLEASQAKDQSSPDYIGKYRDFKYQETLFDLYSKQYELARMDESREGALIQVIDPAQPAEHKNFPRRALFAAVGALLGFGLVTAFFWRRLPIRQA